MVSSNMALRWVPYPTQVVGKSAKPIPVMILGVLIGRKSYSLQRYLCVFVIVVGVVLFMFKEGRSSTQAQENIGIGELLLILSLSMDGLTGAIQERMRSSSAPTGQQMMLGMNGWSSLFLMIPLLLTGELHEFLAFAGKYPHLWGQLGALALTGALGQIFIFMMVNQITLIPQCNLFLMNLIYVLGTTLWSISLFCGHDHKKILHCTIFSDILWKYVDVTTMVWCRFSIFWTFC